MQIGDGRVDQGMGIEELGLCLASTSSFAVPPTGTIRVEIGTGRALDRDPSTLDLKQRAIPLFIAPGGLAFKNYLPIVSKRYDKQMTRQSTHGSIIGKVRQVQRRSRRNRNS